MCATLISLRVACRFHRAAQKIILVVKSEAAHLLDGRNSEHELDIDYSEREITCRFVGKIALWK
ncbi:MAG: hypothetical protein ACI9G1_002293 [Pirellulaceae bacterium]|jgi:hypothetical protein